MFGIAGVVVHAVTALLASVLLDARHDIVDSEEHACCLNGGLKSLELHGDGVPDIGGTHVHDLANVSVDTLVEAAVGDSGGGGMAGSQLGHGAHDVGTTVLGQGAGDNLDS